MNPTTSPRSARQAELVEEQLGVGRLDGDRHLLVWIHDAERSVSVVVDRPFDGGEIVRLLGVFGADESPAVIETLIRDYREHYLGRPRRERIAPRPLEPEDLVPPAVAAEAGRG